MKIALSLALAKLLAGIAFALATLTLAVSDHSALVVAQSSGWNATFNDDAQLDASQVVDRGAPAFPARENCYYELAFDDAGNASNVLFCPLLGWNLA